MGLTESAHLQELPKTTLGDVAVLTSEGSQAPIGFYESENFTLPSPEDKKVHMPHAEAICGW